MMRLVEERYGLVPIQTLERRPVPPRVNNIQRQPQPEFRVHNFRCDNAVNFLRLLQEMSERHRLKMCATCVGRVPLHTVKGSGTKTKNLMRTPCVARANSDRQVRTSVGQTSTHE